MTVVVAAQLDLKAEETGGVGESAGGAAGGTKDSGRKRAGKPHRAWSGTIAGVSTLPLVFSDMHMLLTFMHYRLYPSSCPGMT